MTMARGRALALMWNDDWKRPKRHRAYGREPRDRGGEWLKRSKTTRAYG